MNTDALIWPRVNHAPTAQIDGNMTAVVDDVSALHAANAHRHKRTVVIPIHRVVGLPRKPAMVVGVVDPHVHARSIKALQYKARAIDGTARGRRIRLNIARTHILISSLDKGINAIVSRSIDCNARRRHIGKLTGAITRKLNRQAADLRIVRRILITNLCRTLCRNSAPALSDGPVIRPQLDIGSIRGSCTTYIKNLIAAG